MDRLTEYIDGKAVVSKTSVLQCDCRYCGQAVDKLANFENIIDSLDERQKKIEVELDKLRSENKDKTIKFKELLTEKLMNTRIIITLKQS